ncbi:MAG: arsenical resistance operon transcriptional repressor ArsD [Spirochaetaceae bacterium]|nr:MAG: arsenical resistance operon transcriptional repressor ArsD [Spirochaetaceae bacterium]
MSTSHTPKIELFDPPMCCPGGLCGPAIDPALLDMDEAALKLKREHGVKVERYLLQQNGQKFMENPEVLALLQAKGTDILPVTAVDGKVVKQGGFPSYDELVRYLTPVSSEA